IPPALRRRCARVRVLALAYARAPLCCISQQRTFPEAPTPVLAPFHSLGRRLFPRRPLRQAHASFQEPPFVDAPLDAGNQRLSRRPLFLFHPRLRPFTQNDTRPLPCHLISARISLARRALPEIAAPAPRPQTPRDTHRVGPRCARTCGRGRGR